jgi:hypothetical protein
MINPREKSILFACPVTGISRARRNREDGGEKTVIEGFRTWKGS